MPRSARVFLLVSCFVSPLLGAPDPVPAYRVVATLPDVVDGQSLQTLIFDRQSRHLYAGSANGVYVADLTTPATKIRMRGPLVRDLVEKVEVVPDLQRVAYGGPNGAGLVDATGGASTSLTTRRVADLVYEPTRHEIYVSFALVAEIQVFDARTGRLRATIALPGWNAYELEAVPGRVFCLVGGKNGLYSIESDSRTIAPWTVAGKVVTPAKLEADPSGRYLFLARTREIDGIDLATHKVVGKIGMIGTASISFDPGPGVLVAMLPALVPSDQHINVIRADATGLHMSTGPANPSTGLIGVVRTNFGFVQLADHQLLVWAAERPAGG